ncbi:MAG: hypothetical protein PUB21_04620 [Bacteroidales bacterium]|nr:hypothetical protein [Bacteroidales bacterium]
MNDTLSAKIFQKDTTNISIYDIPSIREIIDTDIFIVEILTKISDKRYKAKELKTFPNLNTIITQSEIEYLRNIFNNPDLVLIPIGFFVRNIGPFNSIGFSKFRLYDLNSGELIFDCTKNLNVNVSGPEGKAYITGGLFSLTFDYFEKKFISKLNNIKE